MLADAYPGRIAAAADDAGHIAALVRRGATCLMRVRTSTGASVIVDGDGVPFLWAVNATKGIPGARRTLRFTDTGSAVSVSRISAVEGDVQSHTLDALFKHELLTTYSASYWRSQCLLGTKGMPLEVFALSGEADADAACPASKIFRCPASCLWRKVRLVVVHFVGGLLPLASPVPPSDVCQWS